MDVKEICGFYVYMRFRTRKTIENVDVYDLFARD
jgi:hypothetical protein